MDRSNTDTDTKIMFSNLTHQELEALAVETSNQQMWLMNQIDLAMKQNNTILFDLLYFQLNQLVGKREQINQALNK